MQSDEYSNLEFPANARGTILNSGKEKWGRFTFLFEGKPRDGVGTWGEQQEYCQKRAYGSGKQPAGDIRGRTGLPAPPAAVEDEIDLEKRYIGSESFAKQMEALLGVLNTWKGAGRRGECKNEANINGRY